MKDPVVLITGALTGIGRATALAFANEGGRIVASGRHDAEGHELVAELRKRGAEAEFLRSDVRRENEVRSLVDRTVAWFGRLDVALNTAGTEGKPGPVTAQSAESYAATFDTNVLGTLLSMKHELRVMLAQGSGSIVNVSSTYGRTGGDDLGLSFEETGAHVHPDSDWSPRLKDPALQAELQSVLCTAIDELPAGHRTIFLLHDVKGLSNRVIAAALRVKVATIKSRVHRARLFLRCRLAVDVGRAEAAPGAVGGSTSGPIHRPLPPLAARASAGRRPSPSTVSAP